MAPEEKKKSKLIVPWCADNKKKKKKAGEIVNIRTYRRCDFAEHLARLKGLFGDRESLSPVFLEDLFQIC